MFKTFSDIQDNNNWEYPLEINIIDTCRVTKEDNCFLEITTQTRGKDSLSAVENLSENLKKKNYEVGMVNKYGEISLKIYYKTKIKDTVEGESR